MHSYTRICPQCGIALTYSTKGNYDQAEMKGTSCAPCSQAEAERWNAGKNKANDHRVAAMAANVSKAHNDPALRAHLDAKKKLPKDQLLERIREYEKASTWELSSTLDGYTKLTDRNLLWKCKECKKEVLLSVNDIKIKCRCKNCNPIKGKGKNNPAYCPLEKCLEEIENKYGSKFEFDPLSYSGKYGPMDWRCSDCGTEFQKTPKVLLQESYACPTCARKEQGLSQSKTEEDFYRIAHEVHGKKFTYLPKENQEWKNEAIIDWECNDCTRRHSQSIGSHLSGSSCSICSQKIKHTTSSFIAKSKKIWGPDAFDYSYAIYTGNKDHVELSCKKCKHQFFVTPANHWTRGCPQCAIRKFVSRGETQWLDSLGIPTDRRNKWVIINGEKFNCDGVVEKTIYEFYGDYWHGNPNSKFAPEHVNHISGMTMAEHYQATMDREELLKEGGYTLVTMWESDWNDIRSSTAHLTTS